MLTYWLGRIAGRYGARRNLARRNEFLKSHLLEMDVKRAQLELLDLEKDIAARQLERRIEDSRIISPQNSGRE